MISIKGYDVSAVRRALILKTERRLYRTFKRKEDPSLYDIEQYNLSINAWQTMLHNANDLYLQFDSPLDDMPVGFTWHAHAEPGPVLEKLLRPVVIIKADDLYVNTFPPFLRLIHLMTGYSLPVSIGLVTGDIPLLNHKQKAYLSALDDRLVEIWHHGYDHAQSRWPFSRRNPWYEFKNRPLAYQQAHLRQGVELARRELGMTLSTFGAPYNQVDAVTDQAVAGVPEIRVAFHLVNQHPLDDVLVLPKAGLIEESFRVKTLEQFKREFKTERAPLEPITLEIHPLFWEEADWINFEHILQYLARELQFNFMTPIGFARWRLEAHKLRCIKVAEIRYRVSTSYLENDHVITNLGNLTGQAVVVFLPSGAPMRL